MPTIQQPRQDTPIRVFQKTNEERKAFLIEIQTLKEYREELIKSHTTWTNFISELRNNILNSDVFKAFSYICKVLKTFSEAPQTTNFINNFRIELQKISETPLFQSEIVTYFYKSPFRLARRGFLYYYPRKRIYYPRKRNFFFFTSPTASTEWL